MPGCRDCPPGRQGAGGQIQSVVHSCCCCCCSWRLRKHEESHRKVCKKSKPEKKIF